MDAGAGAHGSSTVPRHASLTPHPSPPTPPLPRCAHRSELYGDFMATYTCPKSLPKAMRDACLALLHHLNLHLDLEVGGGGWVPTYSGCGWAECGRLGFRCCPT